MEFNLTRQVTGHVSDRVKDGGEVAKGTLGDIIDGGTETVNVWLDKLGKIGDRSVNYGGRTVKKTGELGINIGKNVKDFTLENGKVLISKIKGLLPAKKEGEKVQKVEASPEAIAKIEAIQKKANEKFNEDVEKILAEDSKSGNKPDTKENYNDKAQQGL